MKDHKILEMLSDTEDNINELIEFLNSPLGENVVRTYKEDATLEELVKMPDTLKSIVLALHKLNFILR